MERLTRPWLVPALVAFLVAGPAHATLDAVTKCQVVKLKAIAKQTRSALSCHRSALVAGVPVDGACLATAAGRLVRLFANAEATGACPANGDAVTLGGDVDAFVARAVTAVSTPDGGACAAPMLHAAGRYAATLAKAHASYRKSGGDAHRLFNGQSRALARFGAARARALCDAFVGAEALVREATGLVTDAAARLLCGDGVRQLGEVCDGADDRACPGQCRSDCTCAQPPPHACLASGGPLLTLAGTYPTGWEHRDLAAGARLDARGGTFLASPTNLYPIRLEGGPGVCVAGATVAGQYDRTLGWSAMHDPNNAGLRFENDDAVVDGVRIDNVGDGLRPVGANFTIRGVRLSWIRDDCVENDHLRGGLITDSVFDGCYVAVSERPSDANIAAGFDGRRDVLTIHGSLLRLEPMPGPREGDAAALGHGSLFKWHALGTKLALHDNVFLAEQLSEGGAQNMTVPDGLVSCADNVMVWLGPGPYPAPLPDCFTVTTDRRVWEDAVAEWEQRHPELAGR